MEGNFDGYRQGASGVSPAFEGQIYRRQPNIMGPLHRGFGFNPEGILLESKDVARRRADEAESLRKAAQTVSLRGPESGGWQHSMTKGLVFRPDGGDVQSGGYVTAASALRDSEAESRLEWQEAPRAPTLGQLSRSRPVVDFDQGVRLGAGPSEAVGMPVDRLPAAGAVNSFQLNHAAPNLGKYEVFSAPAATLTGRQPAKFAVALGVFVDSAVCLALLTLAHLGAELGNWAARLRFVNRELSARFGLPTLPDEAWRWVVVFVVWAAFVYGVQLIFTMLFRSTVGRFLAGIAVDPVASRARGAWSLPAAEVLSFGGLFIVPLLWLKTDRHPLTRALRFHIPPK